MNNHSMISFPGKVLIVEDDPDISLTLKSFLEGEGYEVQVAENGMVALEVSRQFGPLRAILLDMKMPVMGGREFGIEFRQRCATTPIIVMTAFADNPDTAAEIGASAWIRKPFNLDEVLINVKRFGSP